MTVYGQEIPCARAEKGADYVRAFDENGVCVFEATNVKSFEGYALDGGEWGEAVTPPTNEELARSLASVQSASAVAFVALCEVGTLDAVTASEHADLFAEWAYPIAYTVGQFRRYNGKLYRCVQAHTSQADWTPDTAASLWSVAADPAEEWPAWSQPVGAHDAYAKGDKVSHNGKHWTSNVDSNVWEPGTAGTENLWTEATE